ARGRVPRRLPAHALVDAADGRRRPRTARIVVPPSRNRRRPRPGRPHRTMNPRAALLLAALPLVALHAPSQALERGFLHALPGLDRVRLAIPDGSLAGHTVVVYEVDARRTPQEALAEVERHWRAQGVDTVLQAQTGEWHVLSRHASPESGGNGGVAFDG